MTRTMLLASALSTLAPLPLLAEGSPMSALELLEHARTASGTIVAVEILHLDELTQTQIPVTPEMLPKFRGIERHHVTEARQIEKLLELVEASGPTPVRKNVAVRWKIAFLDRDEHGVLEVFHAASVAEGYVGAQAVSFGDDRLLAYLRSEFVSTK